MELEIYEEEFPVKNKNRAQRRHNSVRKAIRKRNISMSMAGAYGKPWYNNLHQFSKNKIHCSCWMCSFYGWTPAYVRADEKYAFDMKEYALDEIA